MIIRSPNTTSTEQILSHASIHEGNESPPPYLEREPDLKTELLRQGAIAGRWLHDQGYRGTASADFLVVDFDDRTVVYVCEINARVTGATYPSILARHFLPDGAWLLRNLRFTEPLTGSDLLGALNKSGDLYIPKQSEAGIIPINFNFGDDGMIHKGQFFAWHIPQPEVTFCSNLPSSICPANLIAIDLINMFKWK